ncbi:MAG: hypothetical protein DWQ44_09045 [Bacteroidetes bacterium]|nr:MAG: hypothetical protein DWQ33_02730 [Bacteroidota bacterium]REK06436.1 MAG: hypothetical protein DWQ39_02835 [Bacteroidota bacterium]REK33202.1 MAG: hypothetical protein DWQ44_09045 [Bacteroidota bacterium]REK47039.1 MAG: hypothetical protein DWQ48_13380 [Bacteroidota bacterium]
MTLSKFLLIIICSMAVGILIGWMIFTRPVQIPAPASCKGLIELQHKVDSMKGHIHRLNEKNNLSKQRVSILENENRILKNRINDFSKSDVREWLDGYGANQ